MHKRHLAISFVLLASFVLGCTPMISDGFLNAEERLNASSKHTRDAVRAQKSGDGRGAQSELNAAVAARGGDTRARTEVACLLIDFGCPDMALEVMQPVLQAPETEVSPDAWSVLLTCAMKRDDQKLLMRAGASGIAACAAIAKGLEGENVGDRERAIMINRAMDAITFLSNPVLKKPDDAIKMAELLVAFAKQSPLALSRCAVVYAELGGTPQLLSKAITYAEDAILFAQEQGVDSDIASKLKDAAGWTRVLRGTSDDLAIARIVLRDAVDHAPTNPTYRYHMARLWEATGLLDRAVVDYQRTLLLRPDDSECKQRLKSLLLRGALPRVIK